MNFLKTTLANKLVQIAITQVKTAYDFKRERMAQIKKSEEFYFGRKIKVPKGRFGVPLPTMSGFVDTLMSKIDDPPVIKYGYTDLADLKLANKLTSTIEKEGSSIRGNWAMKDRWGKKLACFSGRTIAKYYAESSPKYKSNWSITDYEDFLCEPAGGGHLEEHLFCGQDNVFRSKAELLKQGENGLYDSGQVQKLIAATNDQEFKKSDNLWAKKSERFKLMGLNLDDNTYLGQGIFRLVEWAMEYDGKRYYLLFDYITGVWIRAHELKQIFESDLYPWHSWATHEDPFIFWSKAPCDDVRPIADAMDVLFNQALDNRQKRNMIQRAYDPEIFPDPSELEWRPDGLARATPKPNQSIQQGIYEFKVPEISGTIDLIAYMDSFMGRKSGITPEIQGVADKDQKVGIYFGNLQQVADRLGLFNKSYNQFWEELGLRHAWGAKEHLTEQTLMDMIGEDGAEWNKQKGKAPNLDVTISGGSAEIMANEAKAKKRENALMMISGDEELRMIINPYWRLQEILKHGAYEEPEIKIATSKEEMGSMELLSEAAQAIQDIVDGKEVKLNRGANTAFIQKILDYAIDKDVDDKIFVNLIGYAQAHVQIAMENATRKAMALNAGMGTAGKEERPGVRPAEGERVEAPIEGSPAGTASKSGQASSMLRGSVPAIA